MVDLPKWLGGASVVASLLLTLCAEVGIRDQSGQERGRPPEVSRCCLSAEPAIVRQLQGCATPGLFGVYSAAWAKCSGRGESIVCRQVCLSCTGMLTSSPSEFRETIKSRWMEADLHKQKDTLNTLRPTPAPWTGRCLIPGDPCWMSGEHDDDYLLWALFSNQQLFLSCLCSSSMKCTASLNMRVKLWSCMFGRSINTDRWELVCVQYI